MHNLSPYLHKVDWPIYGSIMLLAIEPARAEIRPTIMDKSLGANLHLWRFFTRAKQTVTRKSSTLAHSLPPPPSSMLDTCTRNFSRVSTLYGERGGGGATQFETDNSAFLKLLFKNTENQCNYTSVTGNFAHHCRSNFPESRFAFSSTSS